MTIRSSPSEQGYLGIFLRTNDSSSLLRKFTTPKDNTDEDVATIDGLTEGQSYCLTIVAITTPPSLLPINIPMTIDTEKSKYISKSVWQSIYIFCFILAMNKRDLFLGIFLVIVAKNVVAFFLLLQALFSSQVPCKA